MFVSVLDGVPETFEVEWDEVCGDRHLVVTPIAVSEDERRLVAVVTSLYPFEEAGFLMHELQFAIAVYDLESDDLFETCERDMAKGYVPDEARPGVMGCVCGAVRALIAHVQPTAIYRVTKATRPPPKALHKHEMITDTLHDCGYETTQRGTDRWGREYWTLER